MAGGMELIRIYQCFCERTRLRILHLLTHGPLCVCHFQDLLGESQVKISKHLAYLKRNGLVLAHRHQNWMIYSLPPKPPGELEKNLRCLQDCALSDAELKADLRGLKAMERDVAWIDGALECCSTAKSVASKRTGARATKGRSAACR
jgi:ArsR family transcriptional regulator